MSPCLPTMFVFMPEFRQFYQPAGQPHGITLYWTPVRWASYNHKTLLRVRCCYCTNQSMGCCSSKTQPELPMEQRFSPEVLSLLVGGTGESPSPTIDLKTCKAKTSIDGALWGELLRAGFAFLVQHKAECNRYTLNST